MAHGGTRSPFCNPQTIRAELQEAARQSKQRKSDRVHHLTVDFLKADFTNAARGLIHQFIPSSSKTVAYEGCGVGGLPYPIVLLAHVLKGCAGLMWAQW